MMKQRWGLDKNVLRPTPGDPRGAEQHHWNTGAKENQPVGQATDKKKKKKKKKKNSGPNQLKLIALCRGHHRVWRPTHRRAIKEASKVINRDWVKH